MIETGPRTVLLLGIMYMVGVSFGYQSNDISYTYPKALAVCQRPWRSVLKLGDQGNVVDGTIAEVRRLAITGTTFRIKLFNSGSPYVLKVDNINVQGEHVYTQSIWHLSHNGTHISTDLEWLHYHLCTDGRVEVFSSPYSLPRGTSHNFTTKHNFTMAMLWYVKELGCHNPVYSHFRDGTWAGGSLKGLVDMAAVGEARCVMRDRGYALTMNNIVINRQTMEVNGQSLTHVSQRFSQVGLNFHETPYYWYSSCTTNGRRDNTRYFVGTAQPRGHNNDFVALDWHVDSCWREVYVNDKYGMAVDGSLDELVVLISLGHRVRLMFQDTVLEANSLRISGRTVIAQNLEEMKRRGGSGDEKFFFSTETLWKWTIAHTSGKVNTYFYRVKNMTLYNKRHDETDIHWMVDTRPWKLVHTSPTVDFGKRKGLDVLTEAVELGASFRLRLQHPIIAADFFFTNADNVRYDTERNTVFAQCLRHIGSTSSPNNSTEHIIPDNPFHWFLMISSDGAMVMSAWRISERTQLYESVAPNAKIKWFASY